VHYPGDVICGGILGVIVAYLMFLGTRYLLRLKKSD
jgi:membrane-associated phospholipid phosphatase